MGCDSAAQPFVTAARAQTMLRDFAAEAAWDRCERWVDQPRPVTTK
jgi:hypothetical protein